MADRQLSLKQQKFISAYLANNGNALQSARDAGYKGNDNTLGQIGFKMVNNGKIKEVISAKIKEFEQKNDIKVLTRLQRQQFWTNIILDPNSTTVDKLRASELLGKSEADFKETILNQIEEMPVISPEERKEIEKQSRELAIRLAKSG